MLDYYLHITLNILNVHSTTIMVFTITIDRYHLQKKLTGFHLKQLSRFQALHYEKKGVIKYFTMLAYQSYLLYFRMVNEVTLLNDFNDILPITDIEMFMLQISMPSLEMVLNKLLIFNKSVVCVQQDLEIEIYIQIFPLSPNNQN